MKLFYHQFLIISSEIIDNFEWIFRTDYLIIFGVDKDSWDSTINGFVKVDLKGIVLFIC